FRTGSRLPLHRVDRVSSDAAVLGARKPPQREAFDLGDDFALGSEDLEVDPRRVGRRVRSSAHVDPRGSRCRAVPSCALEPGGEKSRVGIDGFAYEQASANLQRAVQQCRVRRQSAQVVLELRARFDASEGLAVAGGQESYVAEAGSKGNALQTGQYRLERDTVGHPGTELVEAHRGRRSEL